MRSYGEADPQDRLTRSGVDADRATVAIHDDAPSDVEAKAGALAHVLCRVERLERTSSHLGRL